MPVLQFKDCFRKLPLRVPHHILEFDASLSALSDGEKPELGGNVIIEGDNLLSPFI